MKRIVMEILFILVLGVVVALIYNHFSGDPLPITSRFDAHRTDLAIVERQEQSKEPPTFAGSPESPTMTNPSALSDSSLSKTQVKPESSRTASPSAPPAPTAPFQAVEIDAESVQVMMDTQKAILLDARPAIEYTSGHIPGALSLPILTFDASFPEIQPNLDSRKTIITYCIGVHCTDSTLLAHKLHKHGFNDVLIFKGGIEEWRERDYPVESAQPPVGEN